MDGLVYRVFQCDECMSLWDFGGEKFEIALSFAVAPDGTLVDPNAPHKPMTFD